VPACCRQGLQILDLPVAKKWHNHQAGMLKKLYSGTF
jgi:hypothetical protein